MRQFINHYGVAIVVLAAVVAVGVIYMVSRSRTKMPTAQERRSFYIDEETGDESTHFVVEVPPLMGSGGKPTVVEAMKFTRDEGKTTFIGYLQKYTPEAKEALERAYKTGEPPNINARAALLVRLPEKGSPWYPAQSEEGERVINSVTSQDGTFAAPVWPK